MACDARQPGDEGIQFDQTLINQNEANFPQMKRWSQAGARHGIPRLRDIQHDDELRGGSSKEINDKIEALAADLSKNGGPFRALLLKDGTYRIDERVNMRSNIFLIGESRDGVRCEISMTSGRAFYFGNVRNTGIYRMTITGTWGRPRYEWNIGDQEKNYELPDNSNVSVLFSKDSKDCWIDNVQILDSADFPLRCTGEHITMRNMVVSRVHNKNGGSHGYWIILGRDNLVTKSRATQLRHISIQGGRAEYNVMYDNNFKQEVSFHVGDLGNNLITRNSITLPEDMPNGSDGEPDYRAIMGPWSIQHEKSTLDNFLLKNTLLEKNHGDARRMNDDRVYKGPIFETSRGKQQTRNFPVSDIKPIGGELYPIIL